MHPAGVSGGRSGQISQRTGGAILLSGTAIERSSMKRSLITAVIIAVVVGAVAIISHATGWFAAIDMPLKNWLQKLNGPSHDLSKIWQHNLIVVLGLATAWITITNARRHGIAMLVFAIVVELLALTWVLSLFHIFFAPLPSILAVVLNFGAALGYLAFAGR